MSSLLIHNLLFTKALRLVSVGKSSTKKRFTLTTCVKTLFKYYNNYNGNSYIQRNRITMQFKRLMVDNFTV